MGKKLITLLVIGYLLLAKTNNAYAADFRTDYVTEYTPVESGDKLITKVKLDISITNLRSDLVIKKMSLMFPKDFHINYLKTWENGREFEPLKDESGSNNSLVMELSEPEVGRDKINRLKLEFDQEKLFQENGNIWEVILPVISSEQKDSYKVIFNLPEDDAKKISIAKPPPDIIENGQAVWNNYQGKAIYAAFGEKQYYDLKLNYNLYNPKLVSVYTDVAFPPDTLYQKIYLKTLNVKPAEVIIDDDGNFLGRYYLKPKEKVDVFYQGTAEIFSVPRKELRMGLKENVVKNKQFLLAGEGYWKLDDFKRFSGSLKDIYNNIVSTYSYDYTRNLDKEKRMGVNQAIKYPGKAVCTEFTDTFVAFARSKGIPAREIQGYGFSREEIRPITYESDVLHAWPEYFDELTNYWKPIDPTWENTSGIDYFTQLDFNHIAFAIHGKSSKYPVPAGSYKTGKGKTVNVTPIDTVPEETKSIIIAETQFPSKILTGRKTEISFVIENKGNVFLWNIPIKLKIDQGSISKSDWTIPAIAPLQKITYKANFTPNDTKVKKTANAGLFLSEKNVLQKSFNIIPYYYELALQISLIIAVVMVILAAFLLSRVIKVNRTET